MRAAWMIAVNFLRESRWPILLLMLWAAASGVIAALTVGGMSDDALFFLKQQAAYCIFFIVFLAASALQNQRRSRRLLAVLSKGIERREYLAGIVLGFLTVAAMYSAVLGITGAWTFSIAGANPGTMLTVVVMLFLSSALAGTVALFFSTFMNPLLTLICSGVVLGTSAILPGRYFSMVPVYAMMQEVLELSFNRGVRPLWTAMGLALVETVILWLAASWIFARRDVAVSVE